jgi:hypothetical protein
MKPEKMRRILQEERPDLVEIPVAAAKPANIAADVHERAASESTWAAKRARVTPKPDLSDGVSSDEIDRMFAPRELRATPGGENASPDATASEASPAAPGDDTPGLVRAAKRHPKGARYAGDTAEAESGPGVKDFIVDDKRGIIGSQG